jgi:hypothetical protein
MSGGRMMAMKVSQAAKTWIIIGPIQKTPFDPISREASFL